MRAPAIDGGQSLAEVNQADRRRSAGFMRDPPVSERAQQVLTLNIPRLTSVAAWPTVAGDISDDADRHRRRPSRSGCSIEQSVKRRFKHD